MKIMCEYCGNVYQPSSFRPTCICCGAPAPINQNICSCGLLLDENYVLSFNKIRAICHLCFETFVTDFSGIYIEDKHYPNGEITHVFRTREIICPKCGNKMNG